MMLRSLGGWEGTVSGPPDRTCRGDSADMLNERRLVEETTVITCYPYILPVRHGASVSVILTRR